MFNSWELFFYWLSRNGLHCFVPEILTGDQSHYLSQSHTGQRARGLWEQDWLKSYSFEDELKQEGFPIESYIFFKVYMTRNFLLTHLENLSK